LTPALFAALHESAAQGRGLSRSLENLASHPKLKARQRERLAHLATFWAGLGTRHATAPVIELADALAADLASMRTEPIPPAQQERLTQLRLRAASYGHRLAEFLAALALEREADALEPRASRVSLLTMHAAKGLEFPTVFIVGCEEGLLPYLPSNRSVDLEEERRLFYVGMTRAQQQLILTHARRRTLFGAQTEPRLSRFVDDIEAALKAVQVAEERTARLAAEDLQMSLF
jgi:superfamily I DNA/RNA helicase